MQTIILEEFGMFLGKKSERFVIKQKGRAIAEFPATEVERIIISSSGISISSAAIYLAVEKRVPIAFTYSDGHPFGFLTPTQGHGTVITRRMQFLHGESEKATALAKAFVFGKIMNQRNLLRMWAKSRTRTDRTIAEKLFELSDMVDSHSKELEDIFGPCTKDIRQKIMNIEGRCASWYWDGVSHVIPQSFGFTHRETRGAKDPLNMLLNYGYGILYSEIWAAASIAGLDPFAGFLHVDRPGRPSLILDLIEEFRQQTVDRVIIALATKRVLEGDKVSVADELTKEARNEVAVAVLDRFSYRTLWEGQKVELKNIMVRQAWQVARYLKDETHNYKPFILRG